MKETPLTLCEKSSLLANLKSLIRLDGRNFCDIRRIDVLFGKDYGSCTVSLGETRVTAQVTCEVVEPRPSRPNEGKISIAVHLSPMAASHFEVGRGLEFTDEIQQILDRNIKESRCIDVESLCILAEESVWQLKVDVTILNHAGNLGDACNIASVAALRHFHRPDVTVEEDGRVTIHTDEEKELIPTFLKKIPVCLTFAMFVEDTECYTIIDPTEKEERVMSGKLIVGLNPHGEISSLLFPGKVCLEKKHILSCISKAFGRAKSIAEMILNLVEEDIEKRKQSVKTDGYLHILKSDEEYKRELIEKRIERAQEFKQHMDHSGLNEVNTTNEENPDNMDDQDKSSEDEFSKSLLSKSLPEVRRILAKEKRKINKAKGAEKYSTKGAKSIKKRHGKNQNSLEEIENNLDEDMEAKSQISITNSSDEEFSKEDRSQSLQEIKTSKKKKRKGKGKNSKPVGMLCDKEQEENACQLLKDEG